MKRYRIKYQNNDLIEEIFVETLNLRDEKLPKNILEIKEERKRFNFNIKKRKN